MFVIASISWTAHVILFMVVQKWYCGPFLAHPVGLVLLRLCEPAMSRRWRSNCSKSLGLCKLWCFIFSQDTGRYESLAIAQCELSLPIWDNCLLNGYRPIIIHSHMTSYPECFPFYFVLAVLVSLPPYCRTFLPQLVTLFSLCCVPLIVVSSNLLPRDAHPAHA